MEKIKVMTLILALVMINGLAAVAQKGDKKEKELKKEQLSKRERSMGGQQTESDRMDEEGKVPDKKQTPAQASNKENSNNPVITPNKDQNPKTADDAEIEDTNSKQSEKQEKSNTPLAVVQTTSSEGGSPAVLSKNNGRGRDGTNNVQRSTYNMAGATVPVNMNLAGKNLGERNMNTGNKKILKQDEVPMRTNIQGTQRKSLASPDNVGQSKAKSDDDKKQKRKSRRNKDKA